MNRKKSRTVSALFAMLLSAALLGGCGSGANGVPPASGVVAGATTVGINNCTTCHTVQTADWLTSKHANAAGGPNGYPTLGQIYTSGVLTNPVTVPITCKNCHDPNGDSANIVAAGYIGSARPVVGCEACHGGGSLHNGSGPISLLSNTTGTVLVSSATVTLSGQFVMCTNCHELVDMLNSDGTVTNPSPAHLTTAPTGPQNYITDTHFAVAGTGTITGYAMDFSSETVCIDCHNPHKNADINREWAQSAKGNMTAGAWARNWSQSPACQRCHTTTGFAAYADALAAGNAGQAHNILYGTLATSPVPSAANWAPEMLECRGCHTDNKGTLRNPGPYTADYSYSFYVTPPAVATIYSVASQAYPDLNASNNCIPCHVGRQNGDSTKNMNSGGAPVDFTNRTLVDNHHYQAGATMFRAGGYHYDGRDYSNLSDYRHDQIGSTSAPNTGTNGPCIGCHMAGPNGTINHLFSHPTTTTKVVNSVSRTLWTNIPYRACATCHGIDQVAFLNMVNQKKSDYADAQSALQYLLEQAGFYRRTTSFNKARDLSMLTAGTVYTAVSVTYYTQPGNTVINGLNTNWDSTCLDPGDKFAIANDAQWYTIASVNSPTQITLSTPYSGLTLTGTTTAGSGYVINKTESVTVSNGSPIVTGTGTNWTTCAGLVAAGDKFRIDSTWYTILSVDSNSQITLTSNYAGASTTTPAFTLRNNATAAITKGNNVVAITGANPVTLDVLVPYYASATSTSKTADYFRIDSDGKWYAIDNRDATTLTLASNYTGTTVVGPGAAFTIIRSGSNGDWLTNGDTDITGNITGKNNIGAAFNLNMLGGSLDAAAYVHNRTYAKRLMYDAIDWLDDNQMNYSTGTTLSTICTGGSAPAWCAGALNYLLNGVVANGVADERP